MTDEKHPDYEEFDLSDVRTYPLSSRASKVRAENFARPFTRGSGMAVSYTHLTLPTNSRV